MPRVKIPDLTLKEASNLNKRYLIWLYKTIKEPLDRIDRKFTQLEIDKIMLAELKKVHLAEGKENWDKLLGEFRKYISDKEKGADESRFDSNDDLNTNYIFLKSKLRIIENIIKKQFGIKELRKIENVFEEEMTSRILSEREHKL